MRKLHCACPALPPAYQTYCTLPVHCTCTVYSVHCTGNLENWQGPLAFSVIGRAEKENQGGGWWWKGPPVDRGNNSGNAGSTFQIRISENPFSIPRFNLQQAGLAIGMGWGKGVGLWEGWGGVWRGKPVFV